MRGSRGGHHDLGHEAVDALVAEIDRAGGPLSVRQIAERLGGSSAGALLLLRAGLRSGRVTVDDRFRVDAAPGAARPPR